MKTSLQLNTSQRLALTPQLQQSLKLLQLSALELETQVQLALETNPLLEEINPETKESNETLAQEEAFATDLDFNQEPALQNPEQPDTNEHERDDAAVADSRRTDTASGFSDSQGFENIATQALTLYEHLSWQITLSHLSKRQQHIAKTCLRCLDEDGYLPADDDKLAAVFDPLLEVFTAEIKQAISFIQQLDPVGIGARNLPERLSLMLKDKYPDNEHLPLALNLVENQLEQVAKKNWSKLKQVFDIDATTLTRALTLVTSISPRITNAYTLTQSDQITPDVLVSKVGNSWQAVLNPSNQHRLQLNSDYQNLSTTRLSETDQKYIQHQTQHAKDFIKGLSNRYDTLLSVARAIVDHQQAFFDQGQIAIKSLTLVQIADTLGLHPSTISRATAGKYLQSPQGVHELKYFFSGHVEATSGEDMSAKSIQTMIKKLIQEEDKRCPLSDNKLSQILAQAGHKVARRTVAKYREQMNLLPSRQRKTLV